MDGSATFDSTSKYRYSLWREWDAGRSRITFIMLNPSTADATTNDPTIRRCISFAKKLGFGSLEVVNLFALRTPHPQNLKKAPDPIGDDNDEHLQQASQRSSCIVCAWGNWGNLHLRDQQVLQLLADANLRCFGMNRTGKPRHPLYLPENVELISFVCEKVPCKTEFIPSSEDLKGTSINSILLRI
jgi:hypothetical protein